MWNNSKYSKLKKKIKCEHIDVDTNTNFGILIISELLLQCPNETQPIAMWMIE